ncbi:unnamed protein product [Larinioides sclopetarius]|uniref:Uncharacterized protein n=1 Tax=Larinioides sclopetarius TaxID=280406 RepID=A0AAV2BQ40_9ARAC
METSRHSVSYIAVVAFILMYEYSNARPAMDSLYGDHVYSGAIYPVPMKIHSQEKTKETNSQSNDYYTMDSLYGDHVYSGAIYPISGAVPKKIHNHNQNLHSDTSAIDSNSDTSTDGDAYFAEDSLYGDHVYSGAIYPISGAVPKKIQGEMKVENSSSNISIGAEEMKVKKAKKIFDMLGIDLSQINLGQIDGTHKFDGKDSLQPSLCHDTYNDRYGVGKHFIRGVRDVGFAIVSGAEDVLDGLLSDLPLVSNINSGSKKSFTKKFMEQAYKFHYISLNFKQKTITFFL